MVFKVVPFGLGDVDEQAWERASLGKGEQRERLLLFFLHCYRFCVVT